MDKKIKIFSIITATAIFIAFAAITLYSPKKKYHKKKVSSPQIYKKIENHSLELRIISTKIKYYRKLQNHKIRIQLRNKGLAPVTVYEWKLPDTYNYSVEYIKLAADRDISNLKETEWKKDFTENDPKLADESAFHRYQLELCPENATFCDIEMQWTKHVQPGRYAVRGILLLHSLPLKTVPFEISVE